MPFWPFKRREQEPLTPKDVRDRLIEAATSASRRHLRALCNQYKATVAANLDLMRKAPEEIRSDTALMENYVQRLGAVAHCLASECGASELWNTLFGTPDDNPLLRWERWYGEIPQRMERLEHTELIDEARSFIREARNLQGAAARQHEALLLGHMGGLLFHSGRSAEALGAFNAAFQLCREIGDIEGQRAYLNNLLETHRYRGENAQAVGMGEELVKLLERCGADCDDLKRRMGRIAGSEPLCRVVCCRDSKEMELDEVSQIADGRYEFQFRRNRPSLQMTGVLVRQGNELASSGKLADAIQKYQAAVDTDPYDPDPVYQTGVCLLELGAYAKAREAFEEVERLAPGWFQCRTDRWLAESLETGAAVDEEFRLLRILADGGHPLEKATPLAERAVAAYPEFAPFHLVLGDLYRNQGQNDKAMACYRKGLDFVAEPDLESRLLCAIVTILPKESKERPELLERVAALKGSRVAQATATLLGLP